MSIIGTQQDISIEKRVPVLRVTFWPEKQVELLKSFQQMLAEENALYENTGRQYIEANGTTQHLVPFTDMQGRQRHRYVSRLFEFEIKCCLA